MKLFDLLAEIKKPLYEKYDFRFGEHWQDGVIILCERSFLCDKAKEHRFEYDEKMELVAEREGIRIKAVAYIKKDEEGIWAIIFSLGMEIEKIG